MSADEVVVRAAVPQDDPERVFDLLWALAPGDERPDTTRLSAAWRDLHAQAGRELLLAVAGSTFVGTVDTVVVPNLTHGARPYMLVENVVVAPGWRRRGVARALLATAVDTATAAGCYKVQLVSSASRTEAHRFYADAGFSPSAVGYRRYLTTTA
ncbi:GNAT family N-acetyltransferase [Micromonospora sp. WMMD1120]|uniref:GNAT family N-acetyltransferase n=1 Tax=Micromonospora sp. WMMD1120 TaxID=3016106 RepID=UPI0024169E95|nr:GNAT family N-acetyltransferase [Micromonospora sp. WMMD1120]MDG4809665.1 GNAT family N-acetyltransferase [Micromonospora sp. WMMD1120]